MTPVIKSFYLVDIDTASGTFANAYAHRWTTNVVTDKGELNETVRLIGVYDCDKELDFIRDEMFFSVIKYQCIISQGKLYAPSLPQLS